MKNVLLPIVTAALLICGPAAADALGSCLPDAAASPSKGAVAIAVEARAPARPVCARMTRAQFRDDVQSVLSDKEIERALKRQGFQGRLVEMIPHGRSGNQVKVLWETREAGRRRLRTLIVDAKTGKFIREERR